MFRTIIRWVTAAALSSAAMAQQAPPPSLDALTQTARAARESGDFPGYLAAVEALKELLPWSPAVRYSMARAYALNGRKAEAIGVLRDLGAAGWGFDAAGDEVLASLRSEPEFAAVTATLTRNAAPRGTAPASRKLPLAGKQPEGIAVTEDGTVYVGALKDGIHRLDGEAMTKLYAADAGWGVVGLRVDAARHELIACVNDEAAGKGRLMRFSLPALREAARVDMPAARAFCNDSALLPDGRVAFTDSTGGRLWLADRTSVAEVRTDLPLIYPNGVAVLNDVLYVAHAGGLRIVDPTTGGSSEVTARGTALVGIDGLIAHRGALYAVQNGTVPIRILRVRPSAGGEASVDVLASGHPILNGATTAAMRGDRLIVLSQTGIPNGSQPDDPVLVEVPIG